MELQKFEISDSRLEVSVPTHRGSSSGDTAELTFAKHNNWLFPATLKTRKLLALSEEDFLVNHKAGLTSFATDRGTELMD